MDDVHVTMNGERRPHGRRSPRHGAPRARACACSLALALGGLSAAAKAPAASSSPRDPELMFRAEQIRAAVNVRYRRSAGRKLAVTEAATTSVVASISLLDHRFAAARVVDADNGIYFAVCPANATCPYPRPSSSWSATAARPLRVAVELAVRAFRETRTGLVVVALPTHQPVWLVLERDDIVGSTHWPALRTIASRDPAVADAALLRRIDRLSRRHLFAPVGLVSASATKDSLVATALMVPDGP